MPKSRVRRLGVHQTTKSTKPGKLAALGAPHPRPVAQYSNLGFA